MKRIYIILSMFTLALIISPANIFSTEYRGSLLVRNATIHTVTGKTLESSDLLVIDGKISKIADSIEAAEGIRVIDAAGMDLYPGFIDAGGQFGMIELWAVSATVDTSELGKFNPELKVTWALNPHSVHIPTGRITGTTTALILPSGGIFSGIGALVKLDGWSLDEMLITDEAATLLNFPKTPRKIKKEGEKKPLKNPVEKKIKEIKDYIKEARRYHELKALAAKTPGKIRAISYNPKFEAMKPLLDRERPLIISVQKKVDIENAMKFAKEENLKIILKGCMQGYMIADKIALEKIPVIIDSLYGGFADSQPFEPEEPYDALWANPGKLAKAGVKVCFSTGSVMSGKDMPYHAARAIAFDMKREDALRALTINAAEILGIADRVGSIEVGKDADFFLCNGDPINLRTEIKQIVIDGKVVDLDSWWEQIRQKWEKRPIE